MTQTASGIDASRSAILIMDFQKRIVGNFAAEPDGRGA